MTVYLKRLRIYFVTTAHWPLSRERAIVNRLAPEANAALTASEVVVAPEVNADTAVDAD